MFCFFLIFRRKSSSTKKRIKKIKFRWIIFLGFFKCFLETTIDKTLLQYYYWKNMIGDKIIDIIE